MPKAPKAFQWPEVANPQPSSRVISEPKDWRDEALLVPHEAIRWWGRVFQNHPTEAKQATLRP